VADTAGVSKKVSPLSWVTTACFTSKPTHSNRTTWPASW
jgi:hypothetical protein